MFLHFVHAVDSDFWQQKRLEAFLLKKMKEYNIKKVMMTNISMERHRLTSKEKMEKICKGKEKQQLSVNDDLETLFENIQLGEEPDDEVCTYFLPKLTEQELKLIEREDEDFFLTFGFWQVWYAAVPRAEMAAEMAATESKSKYVFGFGWRKTFTIRKFQ